MCDRVCMCDHVCVCVIFGRIGLCVTVLFRHDLEVRNRQSLFLFPLSLCLCVSVCCLSRVCAGSGVVGVEAVWCVLVALSAVRARPAGRWWREALWRASRAAGARLGSGGRGLARLAAAGARRGARPLRGQRRRACSGSGCRGPDAAQRPQRTAPARGRSAEARLGHAAGDHEASTQPATAQDRLQRAGRAGRRGAGQRAGLRGAGSRSSRRCRRAGRGPSPALGARGADSGGTPCGPPRGQARLEGWERSRGLGWRLAMCACGVRVRGPLERAAGLAGRSARGVAWARSAASAGLLGVRPPAGRASLARVRGAGAGCWAGRARRGSPPGGASGRRQGRRSALGLPAAQGGRSRLGAPSAASQRGLRLSRLCAEHALGCLARAGGGGQQPRRAGVGAVRLPWGAAGRVACVASRPCCVGVAQQGELQLRRGAGRSRPGALAPRGARAGPLRSVARGSGCACGGASLGQQPQTPRGASCARGRSAGRRAGRGSGAREAGSAGRSGREAAAPAGARRPRPGRPPASEASPCRPGPSPREPPPPTAALWRWRASRERSFEARWMSARQPAPLGGCQPASPTRPLSRARRQAAGRGPSDARAQPGGAGRAWRHPWFFLTTQTLNISP